MMVITKDLGGPHESARYVMRDEDGTVLDEYSGREASAISALLARKVHPGAVLDELLRSAR